MFTEGAGNPRGSGRQSSDAGSNGGRPGGPGGGAGSGRHGGARSGPPRVPDPDWPEDFRVGGFRGGGSPDRAFQVDEVQVGAFADEGFADGDFQEVAPGVLFCPPATAGDRGEPRPARRPPSGGAWQGSRAAPSAPARGAGAPARPGGRPGLARHTLRRILLAGGAALCVTLAALVLLGSGAGASGTTPSIVGSPSASPSGADAAGDDPPGGGADGVSQDGAGAALVVDGTADSGGEASPDVTGTAAPAGDPQAAAKSKRSSDSQPADATDPDWLEVLSRLDRQRAKALTKLDEGLLAGAVTPGSTAWTADTALMDDLRARGVHPKGLRTEVVAVARLGDVAAAGPTPAAGPSAAALSRGASVTLLVTDRRAGYDLVDSEEAPVQRIGAAGKAHWQVTLIRGATEIGWLVSDVMARP